MPIKDFRMVKVHKYRCALYIGISVIIIHETSITSVECQKCISDPVGVPITVPDTVETSHNAADMEHSPDIFSEDVIQDTSGVGASSSEVAVTGDPVVVSMDPAPVGFCEPESMDNMDDVGRLQATHSPAITVIIPSHIDNSSLEPRSRQFAACAEELFIARPSRFNFFML